MICGERINLRAVERADLEQLVRWRNDPDVFRGFFTTFPLSAGGQEAWYEDLLRRPDKKLFVIETKEGQAVGTIGFDHIDWKNQRAEFGNMLVARAHRGQGYAGDATRTALRFGFEEMNLNRIYLEVYAWNEEAVRLYKKCGFEIEGVLRETYFSEGRFNDTVLMAVLRGTWKTLSARGSAKREELTDESEPAAQRTDSGLPAQLRRA